jgi:hypothetical protein
MAANDINEFIIRELAEYGEQDVPQAQVG